MLIIFQIEVFIRCESSVGNWYINAYIMPLNVSLKKLGICFVNLIECYKMLVIRIMNVYDNKSPMSETKLKLK